MENLLIIKTKINSSYLVLEMITIDSVQIEKDIFELGRAFLLFRNCHDKLYSYLIAPENDEKVAINILGNWDGPSKQAKYVLQLNQLIYAAATSMTALIAVSKILEKRYKNDSFYIKYVQDNQAIMKQESFIFWRRLRNYITHNSNAPITFKVRYSNKVKVYLDSYRLSEFDWRIGDRYDSPKDAKTIEYIMRYKDGIYLANIIYNYNKLMEKIWKDVFIELVQLGAADLTQNRGGESDK